MWKESIGTIDTTFDEMWKRREYLKSPELNLHVNFKGDKVNISLYNRQLGGHKFYRQIKRRNIDFKSRDRIFIEVVLEYEEEGFHIILYLDYFRATHLNDICRSDLISWEEWCVNT